MHDEHIKRAFTSANVEDSSTYPLIQLACNNKISEAERFSPYGLSSNPKVGSQGIVIKIGGKEEDKFFLSYDPLNRDKNLKPGEVSIGSPDTGSKIKFLENSNIEVYVKNELALTLNFETKQIVSEWDILTKGDLLSNTVGTPINLGNHVHGGVTTGGSQTTGPI